MQTLTCPVPSNINPLQSNGFLFAIQKLPELTYFCQEVVLPDLQAPPAEFDNPLVVTPIPGEKLSFGDFSATFLIDESMSNYIAVYNWMIGLGFPESHQQYANFISKNVNATGSELLSGYSDGTLQILNSSNNVSRTVHFVDMFPTSLSSITLVTTTQDTTYLAATATFRYTAYRFE